ncbi:MAG TPA: sigma-70 family RNA polymerase sigma factor, partial [Vicinamibacterales bacterium]|nr:sigma-70 family RNA polymerase sigma factor [Vicinamibacterales bacterium]
MGTALAAAGAAAFDQRGDELTFEALVRRHQAMVFGLALHFLQDRTAAEEVAQDVFLQLHRHLDALQSADHVTFWLRRVTAHRCIDRARRQPFRFLRLDAIPEPAVESRVRDPLLERRLRTLVFSLPAHARLAVILRYQEDLTPEEIARVLDRPVATVKSQLQRALKTLRTKIADVLGEQA